MFRSSFDFLAVFVHINAFHNFTSAQLQGKNLMQ
jgi:hypothetical protein